MGKTSWKPRNVRVTGLKFKESLSHFAGKMLRAFPLCASALLCVKVDASFLYMPTAQFFLHFLPWPSNFCALCIHCFFTVKIKITKANFAANEFQREQAARPHAGIFPDTYIRRQIIHRSLALRKEMRQQHAYAYSLSTPIFFPRRHFASALSRQGKAVCCFGLFRPFYYSFKTKAKVGTTSKRIQKNLPPCPPWSTNLPQLWPNDALNQVRTNDMWGTSVRPLSASIVRILKKKKRNSCRTFHKEVRSAVAERLFEKIWRTAICKRWTSSPREKARKLVVHVDRLERERERWSRRDLGRARDCFKAATARCKTCTVKVARAKGKWFWSREVFLPLTRFRQESLSWRPSTIRSQVGPGSRLK